MKSQTEQSVAELAKVRNALGLDPSKLLVLRLETLDVNQRETLERFDATIVEELKEKRDDKTVHRLLVQFLDQDSLDIFTSECDQYANETTSTSALPPGMRRDLFDALDSVSTVTPEDRTGNRLRREGYPSRDTFYLDVDLWEPGSLERSIAVFNDFRNLVNSRGGRVVKDPLRIPSLILIKVEADRSLLNEILQLDVVSLVDLPPVPPPEVAFDLTKPIDAPDELPSVQLDGPRACVVDSGVLSGHPFLQGWVVAEEDFDSGEHTPTDLNGHGTQVGGLITYGDIAKQIVENQWLPRVGLYSAKVLKHDPNSFDPTDGDAIFHDVERVEDQLKRAIEYFHEEYQCRVFNLSLGHKDRLYDGGRQFPWAELLDKIARELDVLIVISSGNMINPEIPLAHNSAQFQKEVSQALLHPRHRLIDPATAALCLTVGSIARRDDPIALSHDNPYAASRCGCPSPFTRCGPGVAGAVKPELVAPGGNYAVDSSAGSTRWRTRDINLGEPTLNRNYVPDRFLRAVVGSSYAAAQVTHIAARMEHSLRSQFGQPPSQNLLRALLVNSARQEEAAIQTFNNRQSDILDAIGYGEPNVDYCWSSPNRATLIAEEEVGSRMFHVYSFVVPEEFLEMKGKRSISVSLAYDPPTRLSRLDYIATSMWLEIFGGLTTDQVIEFRSSYSGDGEPPLVLDKNKLNFKPGGQTIKMSTVQKRFWYSNQGTLFSNRRDPNGESTLHVFVGCQPRFPNPTGDDAQTYALVVTLEHENEQIDIYQSVRSRVRTKATLRVNQQL